MTELNPAHARRAIIEHTRYLADSAASAGPEAAVPTTPKWSIIDLVEHVGQTQHWTAEIIERRVTDPAQLPTEVPVIPTDPHQWGTWLSESAHRAAHACSDATLDAPVLNAAGDDRTGMQFWMGNLVNEAVIHGFDAAGAAGRPVDIDADLAAALVSHHLAMLTSPTWQMQVPESATAIRGTGQTLQWVATDTSPSHTGAWFIQRLPDAATWQAGTGQADVTVTGPARSLVLAMTRRLPLTDPDLSIDGDTDLAQHWLDHTAHIAE